MNVLARVFRRRTTRISPRHRNAFKAALEPILARPEPTRHRCGCCGADLETAALERVTARCFVTGLELSRVRCSGCGAVQGPLPLVTCSATELGSLYKRLYEFFSEGASTAFQEKTFYMLNPSLGGRYLNYACGDWSAGITHLRGLGWQVWGYEPFQPVRHAAIVNDLGRCAETPFHGVMSHNFIEHVQDPAAFFAACARLVVAGGVMAHSSACYEYVCETSPFHLYFYCGDAVHRLAERSGFVVVGDHRVDTDVPGKRYNCRVFRRGD